MFPLLDSQPCYPDSNWKHQSALLNIFHGLVHQSCCDQFGSFWKEAIRGMIHEVSPDKLFRWNLFKWFWVLALTLFLCACACVFTQELDWVFAAFWTQELLLLLHDLLHQSGVVPPEHTWRTKARSALEHKVLSFHSTLQKDGDYTRRWSVIFHPLKGDVRAIRF